jgi:FkbM family methyltransferase
MIVDFIFRAIGISNPTYLDIGAHHPQRLSNTQYFYASGSRGVNVEPDPDLFAEFPSHRPEDVNLNVGIGEDGSSSLPFHVMSTRTLNTFSREEAERYAATGLHSIQRVIDVPVRNINDVIASHFKGGAPDFLSVDVEGLDVEIIKSLDLSRFRPVVICVETLTFSETREEVKLVEAAEYLVENGYFSYADTYINTIFVDARKWRQR